MATPYKRKVTRVAGKVMTRQHAAGRSISVGGARRRARSIIKARKTGTKVSRMADGSTSRLTGGGRNTKR